MLAQSIAYQLYLLDVQSVIVAGGVKTLNLFIEAGLWDEARVFKGNQHWGKGIEAPILSSTAAEQQKVDKDLLTIYYREV